MNSYFLIYFQFYFNKNKIFIPKNLEIENNPEANKVDITISINSYKKKLGDTNETVFHNLFNTIYLISGENTHVLTTESLFRSWKN